MNWYYAAGGQQQGPVDDAQLDALASSGQINAETLVWHEGLPNWQPLRQARPGAASTGLPPQMGAVAGAIASTGDVVCAECGKTFTRDNAIQYGTAWVCAACKPVFLQKLREGSPLSTAGLSSIREQELLAREYRIEIGDCLERGWKVFSNNAGLIIGTSLVVLLVVAGCWVISMLMGFVIPFANFLLPLFLTGPLVGGYLWFCLRLARGEPAILGDAFAGFSKCGVQLMLSSLIQGLMNFACILPLAIVGGIMGVSAAMNKGGPPQINPGLIAVFGILVMACVAALVYLNILWTHSLLLVIDKGYKFWPAMQLSRKLVVNRWWMTFLFLFVAGIISGLGAMACLVGLLVTVPLYYFMRVFLYDDNFRDLAQSA